MSTDFWRNLQSGFMQLRRDCAINPPVLPAGRLIAIRTAQPSTPPAWRLSYWEGLDGSGVAERFAWYAESAAQRLGCTAQGQEAVWYWLDRLWQDAPTAYVSNGTFSKHEGLETTPTKLLDVCGLSAEYCLKCSTDEVRTAASHPDGGGDRRRPGKQARFTAIAQIKTEIHELKEAKLTQKQICDRLGKKRRPPNASWRHLSWPAAYRDSAYRKSVKSWLSRA